MKIEVRHVMAAGLAIALVSVACAVLGAGLLIAFSPLWLLAFALWWALRRKAAPTAAMQP